MEDVVSGDKEVEVTEGAKIESDNSDAVEKPKKIALETETSDVQCNPKKSEVVSSVLKNAETTAKREIEGKESQPASSSSEEPNSETLEEGSNFGNGASEQTSSGGFQLEGNDNIEKPLKEMDEEKEAVQAEQSEEVKDAEPEKRLYYFPDDVSGGAIKVSIEAPGATKSCGKARQMLG
ncbi:hypothetical protein J5N97_026876 [Dioscorea zingiberensis]|uniref:Uncharacterized protein n=1 Tax=Dioscorea zingiberensis TaxID=325984 RepID=A0A9D5C3U6_9LILI|nr:hypothetical protein J5N97_026876 [Dioscorea zingiberensis]